MKTKKLTLMSILLSIALVIFIIEMQLPPLAPIPGIKLGLANTITLISVYLLGKKEAFVILVLRITIGSIYGGGISSMLYSMSGGLFSFLVICVVGALTEREQMWAVSICAALGHNIAQLVTAHLLMQSSAVWAYLPILLISGVITGLFTGKVAQFSLNRLERLSFTFNNKGNRQS